MELPSSSLLGLRVSQTTLSDGRIVLCFTRKAGSGTMQRAEKKHGTFASGGRFICTQLPQPKNLSSALMLQLKPQLRESRIPRLCRLPATAHLKTLKDAAGLRTAAKVSTAKSKQMSFSPWVGLDVVVEDCAPKMLLAQATKFTKQLDGASSTLVTFRLWNKTCSSNAVASKRT